MRAKTLGTRGTPSLKALAATYSEDKSSGRPDQANLAAIGASATRSARFHTPKSGQSAFGPTGRDEHKRRKDRARQALLAGTTGIDREEASIVLAERCGNLGADITIGLAAARAALRSQSAAARDRSESTLRELQAFRDGLGAQQVAAFRQEFPALPGGARLEPVPTPDGLCFEVRPDTQSFIAESAAWAYQSKQSTASQALREYWSEAHRMRSEEECGQSIDAPIKQNECFAAGRCVCRGQGADLRRFRNECLRAMKAAFPKDGPDRKCLLEGFVVLRLTGRPRDDNLDALVELDDPVKETWLHVGLQYLSPYRPTFHEVLPAQAPPEERQGGPEMWVQAPRWRFAHARRTLELCPPDLGIETMRSRSGADTFHIGGGCSRFRHALSLGAAL